MAAVPVEAVAAPPAPVFVMNLFLGEINPGTDSGAKLFNKAIEERGEKLTIT